MLEAAADAIEDATGALPAEDIGSQLAPRRRITSRRAGSEMHGWRAIQAVDPAGIEPATLHPANSAPGMPALARAGAHGGPTVSGDRHDQVDAVDLDALTDDRHEGLACINCGRSGGLMRPIPTLDNPQFDHGVRADGGVCLRYIARYITGLHVQLAEVVERAVAALARVKHSTARESPSGGSLVAARRADAGHLRARAAPRVPGAGRAVRELRTAVRGRPLGAAGGARRSHADA